MKKLLNNIGMKLLSVFIAFLIWVVVVNVDDPEQTKYFTVKVTAENVDSMLEAGKVYDVVEGAETIVYVTGRRSVVNALKASDFIVTADMESINTYTTVPSVPLVAECMKRSVSISQVDMRCDPASMKISIEDKVEKSFIVTVQTSGKPAYGYELGGTRLIRGDTVVIASSESTLNKIDRVVVAANISGMSTSDTLSYGLTVYDKNGEPMNLNNLEIKTPDGVVIKDGQVKVKITLWKIQGEITLDIGLVGKVAEGYHVTAITTTPETIALAGTSTSLKKLDGVLSCPDAIDVTGASSSIEKSIELTDYLEGESLKLLTEASSTVSVKVQIEKIDATTVNVPIAELRIIGKPENMNMVLTPGDKIPVEIQSEKGVTAALQSSDVTMTLDLTDYQSEGNFTVPVQVELPEGYSLVNEVKIVVDLELKKQPAEETEDIEAETETYVETNSEAEIFSAAQTNTEG